MGKGITMAWLRLLICAVVAMNAQVLGEVNVSISFLETAISKGAGLILVNTIINLSLWFYTIYIFISKDI